MNVITGLIIGLGWLIVGVVNIVNHAGWTMIVLNFVLGILFLALAVRKAIRAAAEEDGHNNGNNEKK